MGRYPFLVVLLLVGGSVAALGFIVSYFLWPLSPIASVLVLLGFAAAALFWMFSLVPWSIALFYRLPWNTSTYAFIPASARNPRESYLFNAILAADRNHERVWSIVHQSAFIGEVGFVRNRDVSAADLDAYAAHAKDISEFLEKDIRGAALLGSALRATYVSGRTHHDCYKVFEAHGVATGILMLEENIPAEYAHAL